MTKEEIQSIFGSRIVSFHAIFAKAIGSVPAAVMLSQAFFWQEKAKSKDGVKIGEEMFFSKTYEEWYEETGLTESQQLTARKHLLSAGFWVEKRAGLPAKMCYRIDIETLVAVISRYLKTGQQVAVDNRKQSRQITRTSSGKFRQLEAEKNGNNIKVENKGELKGEKGENISAKMLSNPFKKVGEIEIPENISLETQKKEKHSPGAGGDVTPGRSTSGAVRLSIVDPELPGVLIEEEIQPKMQPVKTGRSKSKNPRTGTTDEIDLAVRVIEYLNQAAGRSFRINAGENAKGIIARHRDGFTEDEFKKVIDFKVKAWGNDREMCEYLNPVTLFRPSNFERYLQGANAKPESPPVTRSTIQPFSSTNYNEKQAF